MMANMIANALPCLGGRLLCFLLAKVTADIALPVDSVPLYGTQIDAPKGTSADTLTPVVHVHTSQQAMEQLARKSL